MPSSVALRLPAEPRSVKRARDAILSLADLGEDAAERARIVVSELVSNCLQHGNLCADDTLEVRLNARSGIVSGEVSSRGEGFDLLPVFSVRDSKDSGLGLRIVDRLVDRWGVAVDGRTRVWFEIEKHGS
jgi:anti-sigma regulatory factor (Ser/Thr protein kinase)